MNFLIGVLLTSVLSFLLYRKLRNMRGTDSELTRICKSSLRFGVLSVIPVFLITTVIVLTLYLLKIGDSKTLLYNLIFSFAVTAVIEEAVKLVCLKKALRKTDHQYSWLDVTVIMSVIGLGFGLIQTLIEVSYSAIPRILFRIIAFPHVGYGFIMGYFFGRSLKTDKTSDRVATFALPWFIHGLYDFFTGSYISSVMGTSGIIKAVAGIISAALVVCLILFVNFARKQEIYTDPLLGVMDEIRKKKNKNNQRLIFQVAAITSSISILLLAITGVFGFFSSSSIYLKTMAEIFERDIDGMKKSISKSYRMDWILTYIK